MFLVKKKKKKKKKKKHFTNNDGNQMAYIMRVVQSHKRAVTCQVQEATMIDRSKANVILNSKSEYNGARLPRIRMEVGDKVLTRDYEGSGVPANTILEEQEENIEIDQEERILELERTRLSRRKENLGTDNITAQWREKRHSQSQDIICSARTGQTGNSERSRTTTCE